MTGSSFPPDFRKLTLRSWTSNRRVSSTVFTVLGSPRIFSLTLCPESPVDSWHTYGWR